MSLLITWNLILSCEIKFDYEKKKCYVYNVQCNYLILGWEY